MKLRQIAVSFAAAAALSAPALAQNIVVVPVPPPDAVAPGTPTVVVVTPPAATPDTPVVIYDTRQRGWVTDSGGMTEQERADTAGSADPVTGVITAPGYQGPRSTKGQ